MGFFDLIEEHHTVGPPAHRFGQLAALVVTHIARRCPDEPCHRVTFHILRHVKPQQRLLAAKPAFSQRAGQLGLAHAGGAQEQHGTDGPPRFPQTGAAAPDGSRHGGHRLGLTDHLGGQAAFQVGQPFPLGFPYPFRRHTAGFADHFGHIGRL